MGKEFAFKRYFRRYRNYCILIALYVLLGFALFFIGKVPLNAKTLSIAFGDFFVPFCIATAGYFFDRLTFSKYPSNTYGKCTIKIFLACLVAALSTLIANEVELLAGFVDDDYISFGKGLVVNPYWTNVITNVIFTLLIVSPFYLREKSVDNGVDRLDKEKEKSEALSKELNTLQLELYSANVKPHFIFNTLNGLITLVHEDANKAEALIIHLSNFLRSSLYSSGENLHSMQKEIEAIEEYLSIEQIRFGDGISFKTKLNDECKEISVPKFFLLPLVENAIKYNHHNKNLSIEIDAALVGNEIIVSVSDSGDVFKENAVWGNGLKGTQALLKGMFGDVQIQLLNQPKKQAKIVIGTKNV